MKRILFIITFLFFLIGSNFSIGQDKLEEKRRQLDNKVEHLDKLLQKASKGKKSTITDIGVLQSKIVQRGELITIIHQEIELLETNLSRNEEVITSIERDIDKLEKNYAQIIRNVYRNRKSLNTVLFVLSASGFNDAFRRWQYLKECNAYRKKQVELIVRTKSSLSRKKILQEHRKLEMKDLLADEKCQQEMINSELRMKDDVLKKLKRNEASLRQQLNEQQFANKRLGDRVDHLILPRTDHDTATSGMEEHALNIVPETIDNSPLTVEFYNRKSSLPWPVKNGIITRRYGKQQHPVFKTVITFNSGIDIKTVDNPEVLSVFQGEVVDVFFAPGNQNVIIIKHGDYFTAYSNIYETYVLPGDRVFAQQTIGRINTDPDKSILHFEVWKNKSRLNPIIWIQKSR